MGEGASTEWHCRAGLELSNGRGLWDPEPLAGWKDLGFYQPSVTDCVKPGRGVLVRSGLFTFQARGRNSLSYT